MPATTEMARLRREVDSLVAAVEQDMRPNAKAPMSASARLSLRSDLEQCMQRLDELRTLLAG